MNWRRGLLLAGINVAIALPMIAKLAARDAQTRQAWIHQSRSEEGLRIDSSGELVETPTKIARAPEQEQTVTFSPCDFIGRPVVQESVVESGNLPVALAVQWRTVCPPHWSIARMLGMGDGGIPSEANRESMRRVNIAFCIMIAALWFLIGSFPLIYPRRWWSEPGAFITLCTAIGSGIALIPVVEGLGNLPVVFAFIAWLWYFLLLLWKPVRPAWQSTLHGLRRLSN